MPRKISAAVNPASLSPQSTAIVPAKKEPVINIPKPKVLQIQARHLAGESNREIARVEGVDRSTVGRIVKLPELQEHMQRLREKLWGGLDDAVDVVLENIRQGLDPRMAYEFLRDCGLLPRAGQCM